MSPLPGPAGSRPLVVLAVVGTDHHPFQRLVDWVDAWAGERGRAVRVVVQHGSARPPAVAEGRALLGAEELQGLFAVADAIVTHGGPATMNEVRSRGLLPLVVPRDPALGEHVDDHQQRFTRRLADLGEVRLCPTREDLVGALDAALADPSVLRLDPAAERLRADQVQAAVQRVGAVVDGLVAEAAEAASRRRPWARRAAR
ncbi:glycosyltransferase [Vallicoccus soli]|uniref:Glycosyl transferase family 28 n=1 Tax=Vallicoccus soli TaxID=2339232 RepID=A0A3A3Z9W9_9ACTN|nr:glycosyltransferase [Vallicoccus soli]RJK97886.1 glycosyl transferase family 28 [Vallicoccus soli]